MDTAVWRAAANDLVVDITTTGRKTGEPRRIEIWLHEVDGSFFITGSPGTRGWYANLLANPELTVHLKKSVTADVAGRAVPITDPEQKRAVLQSARTLNYRIEESALPEWLERSPMVEVVFQD